MIRVEILCISAALLALPASGAADVPATVTYSSGTDIDQDDMCIWIHPTDTAKSVVIGADKTGGSLFVYDLDGSVIGTYQQGNPGNIDVRYGFPLGEGCVDLIAFNDRSDSSIRVFSIDPESRELQRVDDGAIIAKGTYGFTLYRHKDGRLFGYTGPKNGSVRQYHLTDDGCGHIIGSVTDWSFYRSTVEGMVADDETGYVYLGEEDGGIWRVHAMNAQDYSQVAAVGDASGLKADVEGLAIYYAAGGRGYIIASNQGAYSFNLYERQPPHSPVGMFRIEGVGDADGIDVINLPLDGTFTQGLLTTHSGSPCCPVRGIRWEDVNSELGDLIVDTDYWDPRSTQFCTGPSLSDGDPSPASCAEPETDSGCSCLMGSSRSPTRALMVMLVLGLLVVLIRRR